MQTLEAIARRRSTRDFDPDKAVADEIIDTIVKAGCQAPIGAGKKDSIHFAVLCRPDKDYNFKGVYRNFGGERCTASGRSK